MKSRLPIWPAGVALLSGWAALAFTVFGPTYGTMSSTLSSDGSLVQTSVGQASLLEVGVTPMTIFFLALFALCYLAIFVGALAHARERAWARSLMVAGLVPLLTIGVLSFGLALALPATILALFATALAFSAKRRST